MKSKVVSEPASSQPESVERLPAPLLVHQFFQENNIKPKLVPLEELNAWVGDGHVLNATPLLKVTYEYGKS